MPGMFIDVKVDAKVGADAAMAKRLVEVCPVNIFKQGADGHVQIVDSNLDECTLCDLCIKAAPPGTVQVLKLYDS
jgi:NAD-dependent dihydropyrimidine dehydrogenase PreA subunit